ncbi:MAG: alpha-amylase family glycosyl hydrolase [Anaerolineales bacterium]|jgi:glycosidase
MSEIHVSRQARDKYQFDEELFSPAGRAAVADFAAARRFAEILSTHRASPVPASDINAMGLLDEVFRILIKQYQTQNPGVFRNGLDWLKVQIDENRLENTFLRFITEFPPQSIYHGEMQEQAYLNDADKEIPQRELSLEDMLLLNVTNLNPAAGPYLDLHDDETLEKTTAYEQVLETLKDYLEDQPGFDGQGEGESLIHALLAPAQASPTSLSGQLEFVIKKWGALLGDDFVQRLLRGIDYVREEATQRGGTGGFGGEAPVLEFHGYPEYERFSEDKEWMPRCILLAKNTYVWLEQLSRKYGRWIRYLNDIPDEELDILAQRGFTGLWLIGLWERSRASQRIKERMGDHDAVASAYSLYSYDIAEDLGGWQALENLRWRAWQRGIRLSADMVPNHMGIDSKWVIEHPDWFLSLPHPPYPNYKFESEDLCDDERIGVYLEDHYYNHSDAAVVFKRYDYWSGDTRFIYHGNDGTSMPWNDTAQLDYSKPEVREAVIQTILHVARNFPVIRFDAAMTLAKKHIQRLWFPEPGGGGAIPSRSEHGMPRAEFEAKVPEEFWREVVDRVAAEVPDTLLLAEAFWLMEGYFVRTLGMHRVYNSAFMHMLRDEDNAKYRQVIKNTLEFDPQVLKRYVNFMNNPDEKTAIEQFGNGDKYFGVCTLLATLPGLPMFGHGQVEGLREKYGMEFRKPKWEEAIDEGLVGGHEWKIFPLLHRRSLFAESDNFLLYDFYTPEGHVNEDVFAYSNKHGDDRGLVLYHNKFAETNGWIKTSAAYVDKASGDLRQRSLAEGLDLPYEGYVIFKDYVTHLEYIRSCEEIWAKGLYVQLGAYQHHAFLDWRIVVGDDKWQAVYEALNGSGVESVKAKWEEMFREKEVEEEKPKKPAKKRATKKKEIAKTKTTRSKTKTKKKAD